MRSWLERDEAIHRSEIQSCSVRPGRSQTFKDILKTLRVDGLDEMMIEARIFRSLEVRKLSPAGESRKDG